MVVKKRKVRIYEENGKWKTDYRDLANKRHRATFEAEKEAQAHAKKITATVDALGLLQNEGIKLEPEKLVLSEMSVKDAINKYVLIKKGNSEHYSRSEKYHFEELYLFLVNGKGLAKLHEVEKIHLEEFRAKFLKDSKKASYINRMFATFSPFFKSCVSWGLIAKNPMEGLKKLEEDVPKILEWTKTDKKKVIGEIPQKWVAESLFLLAHLGCRPIDIQRANWGHVSFDKKTIVLTSRKGGKVYETETPLSDEVLNYLVARRDLLKRSFKAKDGDPIIVNSKGNRVTKDALGDVLREFRKKHGLKDLTAYGLRHAFINGLVDLGVHSRDIQILARHRKFETTTRYTHRSNEHLRGVVNRSSEAQILKVGG
jgi:site-specific recombinase XerD